MKRVVYAGESFVTMDSVADTLSEFAVALARARLVETVELPFVADDGRVRVVRILIGPGSELAVIDGEPTIGADDVARRLRDRTVSLLAQQAAPLTPQTGAEFEYDELDFL
jgi:hypothetical protein